MKTKLIASLLLSAASTAFSQEPAAAAEGNVLQSRLFLKGVPPEPADPSAAAVDDMTVISAMELTAASPDGPEGEPLPINEAPSRAEIMVAPMVRAKLAEPVRWTYQGGGILGGETGLSFREGPQAFLGVSTASPEREVAAQLPLPQDTGLVVNFVEEDSPAKKAGIEQNDVLAKIDDQILVNSQQLVVLVANHKSGDTVKITLLRKGQSQDVSVVLGERKSAPPTGVIFDRVAPVSPDVAGRAAARIQPLRTFTQRFDIKGLKEGDKFRQIQDKAIAEAIEKINQSGEATLHLEELHKKLQAAGEARAMDDADVVIEDVASPSADEDAESAKEELKEIRRMLEAVTKKLEEKEGK